MVFVVGSVPSWLLGVCVLRVWVARARFFWFACR